MDAQEFLKTLSPKAQTIVSDNLSHFIKKKKFTVEYSDHSYVSYEDDHVYKIHIHDNPRNTIEYTFLHEFFHCVQHEEGFPSVIAYDYKDSDFANDFSSYILDCNIRYRLENHGYYEHNNDDNILYSSLYQFFNKIKMTKDNTLIESKEDIINYGMGLALILLSKGKTKQTKKLETLIATTNFKVYKISKTCYKHLTENDYNTPEGVSKLFDLLMEELDLNNLIHKV